MAFKHINSQTLTTPSILLTIDRDARALTPITIYNGHSAAIFVVMQALQHQAQQLGAQFLPPVHKTFYVMPNDNVWAISAAASALVQ
jgi:hypothetical protein